MHNSKFKTKRKKKDRQARLVVVGRPTCNYASSYSLVITITYALFFLNRMYGTLRIIGITKLKLISDAISYFTPEKVILFFSGWGEKERDKKKKQKWKEKLF